MKWIVLFTMLAVIAPGIYCLSVMDYEIPINNNLLIGYDPIVGQPNKVVLHRQTGRGTLSGILAGVSHYGELGGVTYGDAANVCSHTPREDVFLHDPVGQATVTDKGPDISVSMLRAWFIVLDGTELHLYSRKDDWHAALATHGVRDARMHAPSRLYSPSVWYVFGVLLALASLLAMSASVAFWAIRYWRRTVSPAPGRCIRCGYDLTGNTSGRCPECGETCRFAEDAGHAESRTGC